MTHHTIMDYKDYKAAAKILTRVQKKLMDINNDPLPRTGVQRCRSLNSTRKNLDKLRAILDRGLYADNESCSERPNTVFF